MREAALSELAAFLAAAPALDGLALGWEDAGPRPGTAGLWPLGVTVQKRSEDVCGTVRLRCRAQFTLRLALPKPDGAAAAENAARLAALQEWAARQSAAGAAPRFGTDPAAQETLAAENAKLERADRFGAGIYAVRLSAEFTDIYEEETT